MLLLRSIVALAGLSFVIYLVLDAGRTDVVDSLRHLGWGIVFVAAIGIVSLALRANAWPYLITPDPRMHLIHWLVSRWIRQAVSQLLPVAQVGGELAGARVLNKFGLVIEQAVSSTVVDLTLGASAQIIFILVGVTVFLSLTCDAPSAGLLFLFTIALLALILIFAYLQQRGLVGLVLRRAARKCDKIRQLDRKR